MKFTVKRSEWLNGEGGINSKLLREKDGKKCCLGFCCLQLGCTEDEIKNMHNPWEVVSRYGSEGKFKKICELFCDEERRDYLDWTAKLMLHNDMISTTQDTRELQLIMLFAEKGHELVFED